MKRIILSLLLLLAFAGGAQSADGAADELFQQAETAMQAERYADALNLYLQAYEAYVSAGQGQTAEAATCQHKAGYVCNFLQRPAEGRSHTQIALELRKQLFGEQSVDYVNSLNNLSLAYSMEEDWPTAIRHQQRAVELCEAMPQRPKNYGMVVMNLGRYYFVTDRYAEAAGAFEKALPCIDAEGELYEKLLTWMSMCYTETKDFDNQRRMMALMEEHNQRELSKPCDEPKCMLERAQYYAGKGDQAQAKEWFLRTLNQPLDAASKAVVSEAYAQHLADVHDFIACAEYYGSAAALTAEARGETEKYFQLMYRAALYKYLGKDYQGAVADFRPLIEKHRAAQSAEGRKMFAQCLKGAGNAANAAKDYAAAIDFRTQLVQFYEATDTTAEEYPKAILQLGNSEKAARNYDVAINHIRRAMAVFESRGMVQEYSDAAASLNMCLLYARRRDEFVDIRTEESQALREARADSLIADILGGLPLTRQFLGRQSYAHSLATLAGCYGMKGEHRQEVAYYRQYTDALREALREGFRLQNEAERGVFWSQEPTTISHVLELLAGSQELEPALRDSLAAVVYDLELISKGILLNSSIEFEKVLKGQGNQRLLDIYSQTKANEAEISRLRAHMASEQERQRILTLDRQNQALVLELYKGCAEFEDFTDYLSFGWQQVLASLREDDVAVEFVFVKDGALDRNKFFYALLLSRELGSPVALRICSLEELKELTADPQWLLRSDNPFWGRLSAQLAGKRRIFFSADGVLNSLGIEYLRYDGQPLTEQFEVYRLSSTKELCKRRETPTLKDVTLFGDIDYDGTAVGAATAAAASRERAQVEGLFSPLENTRKEVEEIEQLLRKSAVEQVRLFEGEAASKKAFLQISPATSLLHIATHGLFRDVAGATEAQSMQNSLLAFAGANQEEGGAADGVVTAAEVSQMNLRQCGLAVLSACETALGHLGADGVFGLQRGFKNAGVQALLMSLRNVNDASTARLMVSFYRHLLEGKSQRQALVLAQQELRRDPLFSDPAYWAAFILLDAL